MQTTEISKLQLISL